MTCGENPVSMSEALDMLRSSNGNAIIIDPTLDYSAEMADYAAYQMMLQLHDMATELADADDDELPIDVADVYMDHARYFRIDGIYKLKRALIVPAANEPTPAPAEHHDDSFAPEIED